MRLWRLVRRSRRGRAYTGDGSDLAPGRWHSPPHRIVYASQNPELAVLEKLVWLRDLSRLEGFVLVPADLPDEHVIHHPTLPEGWDAVPHGRVSQHIGDAWLDDGESAAMQVPSAIGQSFNLLFNPAHADLLTIRTPVALPPALTTVRARA